MVTDHYYSVGPDIPPPRCPDNRPPSLMGGPDILPPLMGPPGDIIQLPIPMMIPPMHMGPGPIPMHPPGPILRPPLGAGPIPRPMPPAWGGLPPAGHIPMQGPPLMPGMIPPRGPPLGPHGDMWRPPAELPPPTQIPYFELPAGIIVTLVPVSGQC